MAMTEAERAAVVAALPAAMTEAELAPAEGDSHFDAKSEGRETLRSHFSKTNRRIYVASELTVYYPDEDRFAPDLLAVCDVDPHAREKWVVDAEGRGVDWVLEVVVSGDRQKDLELNRVRYARLRIPEYFVYDRKRNTLRGWRLHDRQIGIYQPIVPQQGVFRSEVLGVDLTLEGHRLRFRQGNALVLAPHEVIVWLEDQVTDLVVSKEEAELRALEAEQRAAEADQRAAEAEQHAEEERQRAAEAEQRAEGERQRAAEAEQRAAEARRSAAEAEARVAALEAELERLRRG